jgi:hypothetical protein
MNANYTSRWHFSLDGFWQTLRFALAAFSA